MAKSSTNPEHIVTQTLRLPASLNERLKRIAARDYRSLNSQLVRALEKYADAEESPRGEEAA